jgi:excinuclease ABC subunit C
MPSSSATDFDYQRFLSTLTSQPGVYCMLDAAGTVLYIGKARQLKQRLASYFVPSLQNPKTRALVAQIAQIEVTVTNSENEALLLENTLIKHHQPRYNILLRDDKSYPYIYLSAHPFPRLTSVRREKKSKSSPDSASQEASSILESPVQLTKIKKNASAAGQYFGPYPHGRAVHDTLNLLQKLFRLRHCEDNMFRHRSRPCLHYQIKRCWAPCVGLITLADYQQQVQHARLFLQGDSQQVISQLVTKMEQAAQALAYEQAAQYRDQIQSLTQIQKRQYVNTEEGNIDIIAALIQQGVGCVQVLTIRDGRFIGNQAFFPVIPPAPKQTEIDNKIKKLDQNETKISGDLELNRQNSELQEEVENKGKVEEIQTATYLELKNLLSAFLSQYYLANENYIPDEIVLNQPIEDINLLTTVFSQQRGQPVQILFQVQGIRARWLEMALENARASLAQQLPNQYHERLVALTKVLGLKNPPQRLECFDISHTFGEATVASCVVFDRKGPCPSAYRRFNIKSITPGDDYAAMRQAITRRFQRLQQEQAPLPELVLIDGGIGQLKVAQTVLAQLQLTKIVLLGIAKGPHRQPGLETLFLSQREKPFTLSKDSPALHFIQYIRDEAHRFALTGHQKRRAKSRQVSLLDEIEGIGAKRRQRLIHFFGGLAGVSQATVEELAQVPGINHSLAQKIYHFFRNQTQ